MRPPASRAACSLRRPDSNTPPAAEASQTRGGAASSGSALKIPGARAASLVATAAVPGASPQLQLPLPGRPSPPVPPHIKTQPPPALPPSSSEAASSRAAHERTPIPRGSTESTSHEAQDAFYHEVRAVAAGVRGHGRREEEDGPRGPAPGRRRQGAAHLGARQGRRRRRPRRRAPRIHGRRRRCAHLSPRQYTALASLTLLYFTPRRPVPDIGWLVALFLVLAGRAGEMAAAEEDRTRASDSLASVLGAYRGFCERNQIDLELKLCEGPSIKKALVAEATSCAAAHLVLGVTRSSRPSGYRTEPARAPSASSALQIKTLSQTP